MLDFLYKRILDKYGRVQLIQNRKICEGKQDGTAVTAAAEQRPPASPLRKD